MQLLLEQKDLLLQEMQHRIANSLQIIATNGDTVSSSNAVSIGLIVTEGVLNALKHAFPEDKVDGRIVVAYKVNGSDWKLSIADNGTGMRMKALLLQRPVGHQYRQCPGAAAPRGRRRCRR